MRYAWWYDGLTRCSWRSSDGSLDGCYRAMMVVALKSDGPWSTDGVHCLTTTAVAHTHQSLLLLKTARFKPCGVTPNNCVRCNMETATL